MFNKATSIKKVMFVVLNGSSYYTNNIGNTMLLCLLVDTFGTILCFHITKYCFIISYVTSISP